MTHQSPEALHSIFAASPYGQKLEADVRFENFRAAEFVTKELWEKLLGDDINNLRHMPHTYEITKRFCELQGLNEEQTTTLLQVAMTHDWGEAIIGDIPYSQKVDSDAVREQVAYRTIAADLLGEEGQAFSDKVWRVLDHEDEELGDQFEAIENIGYMMTANRASYMARAILAQFIDLPLTRKQEAQLSGGLQALGDMVLIRHYPLLRDFSKKYSAVGEIIFEGAPGKYLD